VNLKKPKFGITAVCDAAYRDALTNKAIIAGLFTGDIVASEYPAVVPLSFFIELENPQDVDERLEFEILVGGELVGVAPAEVDRSLPGTAVLLFSGFPVQITEPGLLEMRVKYSGGRFTILKKKITSNPG
jgi:hypothetical protein